MRCRRAVVSLLVILLVGAAGVTGQECSISPSTSTPDIQRQLDDAAASQQVACRFEEGVFNITVPIILPDNFALVGAGRDKTVFINAIPALDAAAEPWPYHPDTGDGAPASPLTSVFVSANSTTGRQGNITLADFSIDGGLDEAEQRWISTHCGYGLGTDAVTPGMGRCQVRRFGIILWDYYSDAPPTNVTLSGLGITGCAMGVHLLGASGVTIEDCVFERNGGPGTAHFHNAYLIRTTGIVVKNSQFTDGLNGHGLRLSHCSDARLSGITLARNGWDGLSLSSGAGFTTIENATIVENGRRGIFVLDTANFSISRSNISFHTMEDEGGLVMDAASHGLVVDSVIASNAINVNVKKTNLMAFVNVDCSEAYFFARFCLDDNSTNVTASENCPVSDPHEAAKHCGLI